MQELQDCIRENTLENRQEIESCIVNMLCDVNDPIELNEKNLVNALELEGEFLALKLHYDDFDDELKYEKIKYKISQALSVIVRYEDDGNSYENIEKFVRYIHSISDDKQNSTFGVKSVKTLSEFPITILFSGILPINQLKMSVGEKIHELIHSDDSYFIPRFEKHRDAISKEIGIPILPVLPLLDKDLGEYQVRLIDLFDGRLVSEFEVSEELNKDTVEIYLLKLFYIYKVLAEEKEYNTYTKEKK
ncbi:MAG: hypothetical protein U9R50_06275 [Campylobacterota bacterium]|nr:hypothetical protein [Campylobacterota bacterium]